MRANRRMGWPWGVAVGIIAAVMTLAVRSWPQERPLLSRAIRVTPLNARTAYWLLDNHEVITIIDNPYPRARWQQHPPEKIYRQNLTTGQRLFLPALSICFNRLPLNWNFEFQPSSDGKRLLLVQDSMRVHATILTTVDGTQHTDYFPTSASQPYVACWMQDSRHWTEIVSDVNTPALLTLLIHDADAHNHKPTRIICRIPSAYTTTIRQLVTSSTHHVVGMDWDRNLSTTSIHLFETDPDGLDRQNLVYTIRIPPGHEVHDVVLSPDGTRLLWRFVIQHTDPIRQLQHRLLPRLPPPPIIPRTVLCVSRIDGSAMRELGYQDGDAADFDSSSVYGLTRWLPDGKRVSFAYKDVLYTAPAD